MSGQRSLLVSQIDRLEWMKPVEITSLNETTINRLPGRKSKLLIWRQKLIIPLSFGE
jgi:hypothetical protein